MPLVSLTAGKAIRISDWSPRLLSGGNAPCLIHSQRHVEKLWQLAQNAALHGNDTGAGGDRIRVKLAIGVGRHPNDRDVRRIFVLPESFYRRYQIRATRDQITDDDER